MSDVSEILALMAKHEPASTVNQRIGLSPERVRAAAARSRMVELPTPQEARRAAARTVRGLGQKVWGRGGLPEHVWRAMYDEYRSGKSCAEVAAIFGGTRQSIHEIFAKRGLQLRPRHPRLLERRMYNGVAYTPGKHGVFRATGGDRRPLHHVMWEDVHGPIPPGHQVLFKNADHTDLRLENMDCRPIADVTRYHQQRLKAEAAVAGGRGVVPSAAGQAARVRAASDPARPQSSRYAAEIEDQPSAAGASPDGTGVHA